MFTNYYSSFFYINVFINYKIVKFVFNCSHDVDDTKIDSKMRRLHYIFLLKNYNIIIRVIHFIGKKLTRVMI